ncbi:hypothetical protein QBC39DRAFT_354590 [Podospora conica]|nr:hypothetical protein QBC39DRAFT_354590 [Schizothecium conicum]
MMAPPSNNALFQTSGVPAPSTIAARSDLLNELTNTPTGRPSPDVALSDRYFPFEYCWEGVPDGMERGVIRIKNVPYATTRSEVIASLGRSTKILNDADEGVHIIMERLNSKTHDVFIELINKHEATQTVDKFNAQAKKHQYLRLGKRVCQVVMSSQEELMREMFPTARGLTWNGTTPAIDGTPHETWETFKGFINDEEFGMVRRFTEYPHRSPFARDCPQRPYEFQISTLKKFPWHAPEMISFRDRWMLYYYTERLIETLRQTLDHPKHDQAVSRLNEQLMKRLHAACMACPGFTASQKNNITVWAGYEESLMGLPKTHMPMPRAAGDELAVVKVDAFDRNEAVGKYHLPKNPFLWNHIHALRPKAGVPFDLLEWYIAIIRESTMIDSMDHMDFEQQQFAAEMEQVTQCTDYFGRLWCEVGLSTYTEEKLCLLKLKGIGERELNIVKHVIARALDPSKTIPARLQGPN